MTLLLQPRVHIIYNELLLQLNFYIRRYLLCHKTKWLGTIIQGTIGRDSGSLTFIKSKKGQSEVDIEFKRAYFRMHSRFSVCFPIRSHFTLLQGIYNCDVIVDIVHSVSLCSWKLSPQCSIDFSHPYLYID